MITVNGVRILVVSSMGDVVEGLVREAVEVRSRVRAGGGESS